MTVELLYFDGCPNHGALLQRLERLLRSAQVSAKIELRRIPDDDAAQRERFLGSPTVRVDGRDVEPGAEDRDDFGLKCRLYQVPTGLGGVPLDAWVLDAIAPLKTLTVEPSNPTKQETPIETITPISLAAELVAAAPPLTEREQHLAISLYRLLAEGEPVEAGVLADRAEIALEEVERALAEWRGIFTDEQDRVIGFLGLSLRPMPHRLTVNGRALYAWCAYDALFLPELLGSTAEVESQCPTTRERIALTVSGTEVSNLWPPQAVLSYLHKDEPVDHHVINTFCHYIHFFANPHAAAEWTAKNDGTFTISIAEGTEIARRANRGRYPSIFID